MNPWISFLLDIVKISIPALIVYLTVTKILKNFLSGQLAIRKTELKKDMQSTTLPMMLNAYERLTVLCERITIRNLILRMRTENMTTNELRIALLVAMQQEYEHNISQQVYISENLWNIIKVAKMNTQAIINQVAMETGPDTDASVYVKNLNFYIEQNVADALLMAQTAIKQEAATHL